MINGEVVLSFHQTERQRPNLTRSVTSMFDCAQRALACLGALQILNHEGKHSSRDPVILDDHDRYRMRNLEGFAIRATIINSL